MKTILLTIAFTGFIATGYAQQNEYCFCKAGHEKTSANAAAYQLAPARTLHKAYLLAQKDEACTQYRKHNIVVTECPATFYDNSDINNLGYETESAYMGYYPKANMAETRGNIAPAHTTIDNYRGVAPAGGNGCNGVCDAQ